MINITQLQTNLETEIQNLTGSESATDILTLTAALNNLTTNRFVSVQNYANLPNLTTNPLPSGSLILVKQFNIMMMSVGTQWRGIDGRLYVPQQIAYGWGYNQYGALGDNTNTGRSSPVTVVGSFTNWSQVSVGAGAGYGHSLGLRNNGIAYAWGVNSNGQLGDNTITARSSPVTVVGGITNWSQLSTGDLHSLGLTSNGIAYAWGSNSGGQLGDNTTSSRRSPVTVVGGITNWNSISAGKVLSAHSLGLTASGILYAWGVNTFGQLGDDTTSSRRSPVTIVGGITSWSTVSAGATHSVATTSAGVAYAWGNNANGRLGDNTIISKRSPVTVVGGITNWNSISAGAYNNLGLISTGTVYSWGANASGQLGDNTTSSRLSPVTVVGGITNWNFISAGTSLSAGVTSSGVLYAWGGNVSGQLGDNTTTGKSSPVTVVGNITKWTQVAVGQAHALALTMI